MKRLLISVDLLVSVALAIGVLAMLVWQPLIGALLLAAAIAHMIVGIGVVTMLDRRVDGRLTLWLTDRDVQAISAAVIACWPALLWIYREGRLQPQPVSAPKR